MLLTINVTTCSPNASKQYLNKYRDFSRGNSCVSNAARSGRQWLTDRVYEAWPRTNEAWRSRSRRRNGRSVRWGVTATEGVAPPATGRNVNKTSDVLIQLLYTRTN